MQPDPEWAVSLACGHVARLTARPPAGGWITCTEGGCQGQRRVAAVRQAPPAYVQEVLL